MFLAIFRKGVAPGHAIWGQVLGFQIQKLKDSLANCPAGSSEKAALEKAISELSKFLDNTTGWVPKP